MHFDALPLKPSSSPRLTPIMLPHPYYRRSLRPAIFLALACLALVSFYNQAQLKEQTRSVQHAISEGLETIYQAGRTHKNTLYQQGTEDHVVKEFDFGANPCSDFPDTQGVLMVMKTGASEVFDKLPTQLLTNLQCLPDFLLFSDREQQIGQWHVHDALSTVAESAKTGNPEFDLYRAQAECPIAQKTCLTTYRGQSTTAAWSLDKYKFLHVLENAWTMRPNQSWYLFAEADTYVVWPNLMHWLRTRSPVADPLREPAYIGSAAMLSGIPFAHGGSGYILSGALVRDMIEGSPGLSALYDVKSRTHCCGDQMLAKAILERLNIKVQNAHPMFNGEKPTTFPYGASHWCQPTFTMHHMEPEEISAMWQYEKTRKGNGTLLMKDLYKGLIANKMVSYRSNWDNLSDDVCYIDPNPVIHNKVDDKIKKRERKEEDKNAIEKEAHKSATDCAKVCEMEGIEEVDVDDDHEDDQNLDGRYTDSNTGGGTVLEDERQAGSGAEKKISEGGPQKRSGLERKRKKIQVQKKGPLERRCFQYRYHNGVCCTSRSFKMGAPKREAKGNTPDKPEDVWHSGWHLPGIQDWIDAMGECKEPKWKVPDKL